MDLDQELYKDSTALLDGGVLLSPEEQADGKGMLHTQWWFKPADREEEWSPIKVPSFWDLPEQYDHSRNWKQVHEAWYAAAFTVADRDNVKRYELHFRGVSQLCRVYVNGRFVGEHGGRYTPFFFDITDVLEDEGRQIVHVFVQDGTAAYDHETDALLYQVGVMPVKNNIPDPMLPDHPYFGGIWQPVYIEAKHRAHITACKVETSWRKSELTVKLCASAALKETSRLELLIRNYNGGFESSPEDDAVLKRLDADLSVNSTEPGAELIVRSPWEDAEYWSPGHPHLYVLEVLLYEGDLLVDRHRERFGFREFWIDGGDFYLNGVKTRLFGDSFNMGIQMLGSFSRRDYLELFYSTIKQELNVNCIRVHGLIGPEIMYEVADEIGLLMIDQSGIWSAGGAHYNRGGERLLGHLETEFEEWVKRDWNHPSVIIWDVENEQVRSQHQFMPWVRKLDDLVLRHDATRPVQHSGAGSMAGHSDIYHIHHHETYTALCEAWSKVRDKPLVLGEWWSGGKAGLLRSMTGLDSLHYSEYSERMGKFYHERIMEWRSFGVSGVMPYHWLMDAFLPIFPYRHRLFLKNSGEMEPAPDFASPYGDDPNVPKELVNPGWAPDRWSYRLNEPIAKGFAEAFAPVAAMFLEKWSHVWSGESASHTVLVMNDSEESAAIEAEVAVRFGRSRRIVQRVILELAPGEHRRFSVSFEVPAVNEVQALEWETALTLGGKQIYTCRKRLWAYPTGQLPELNARLGLMGETQELNARELRASLVRSMEDLQEVDILILGPGASDDLTSEEGALLNDWINRGGKLLVLDQSRPNRWFPLPLGFTSALTGLPLAFRGIGKQPEPDRSNYASRYAAVYAKGHPVFRHVPDTAVSYWRSGDGRVVDDTLLKPFTNKDAGTANLRVLAGGNRQDYASLLECALGEGHVIFSQLKIADNFTIDPQATWLLYDILSYLVASPERPFQEKVLVLGSSTGELLRQQGAAAVILDEKETPVPLLGEGHFSRLVIGPETEWTPQLEEAVSSLSGSPCEVLLLERKPGGITVFGNHFTVLEDTGNYNGLHFRAGHSLVWGLNGMDCEAVRGPFIRYPLEVHRREIIQHPLKGEPFWPVADVVTKTKGNWFVHLPVAVHSYAAVQLSIGKCTLTVCQLPLTEGSAYARYMLRTLLTNLGVKLEESGENLRPAIRAQRAEDIRIDGHLEEWVCEVGDPNLTKWKRSEPIVLDSRSVSFGAVKDNSDCSGIFYVMHDDLELYIAAHVLDDSLCVWKGEDTDAVQGDGFELIINGLRLQAYLTDKQKLSVRKRKANGKEDNWSPISEGRSAWKRMGYKDFQFNPDIDWIKGGSASIPLNGYAIELAVPLEVFGWKDGYPEQAEFQLLLRDVDDAEKGVKAELSFPRSRGTKQLTAQLIFAE